MGFGLTLGLILGFITGLLLGVVFILRNETSEKDIKDSIPFTVGRTTEKGYIIEEENSIEDLLEVKHKENE